MQPKLTDLPIVEDGSRLDSLGVDLFRRHIRCLVFLRRRRSLTTVRLIDVGVVQLRTHCVLAPEDVPPDPPRKNLGQLVPCVLASRHRKDIVQLLQRALLRLRHEKEDQDERNKVEPRVKPECPLRLECIEHVRERERENRCPKVVCCHRPRHTDFSVGEWKDLCRIRERNGALPGRVKHGKEVDEQGDHSQVGFAGIGDPETEPRGEQCPAHLWEREQEQATPSKGVDRVHCRPSEEEVDQSKSPGCQKRLDVARTRFREDGGRVERNDVDYER